MQKARNAFRGALCLVLIFAATDVTAQGQGSSGSTTMALDWTERQDPNAGLTAHDASLLGDSIDTKSGRLSFEQVDVSIPGNFSLPVEIRRRLDPSQMQAGEFLDWQLAIPTISTIILDDEWYANKKWGKTRCSGTYLNSAIPSATWPTHFGGPTVPPNDYSNGVILDVPGRTTSPILDKTVTTAWPASAKKVTVDGWYLECLSNIDGAGTEGFRAVAPNGDRYTFNVLMDPATKRSEFEIWYMSNVAGAQVANWNKIGVHYDLLAVSEVTDVDGNWVRYKYDANNRLKYIVSSDGRRIDVGRTYRLIESVKANPCTPATVMLDPCTASSNARTWTYTYGSKLVSTYKPPADMNGIPGMWNVEWGTLTAVTLPNSRQWLYDLANLQARPVPGVGYSGYQCKQPNFTVKVTHPDGVQGTFTLQEFQLRLGAGAPYTQAPYCPNTSAGSAGSSQISDVMAVTSKSLSGTGMVTAQWQYSYLDPGAGEIITTIQRPDSSKLVVYNPTPFDFSAARAHARVTKEELYATMSATTPVQVITYSYAQEPKAAGSNFVTSSVQETFRPVRPSSTTIKRGSDSYTTTWSYGLDRALSTYSYGYPTNINQVSNVGGGTRQTDIVYAHNTSLWILGLPSTVTSNGKLFDSYFYDTSGRLTQYKRFGDNWRTYTYYTSAYPEYIGALQTVTDALSSPDIPRTTTFRNWRRGTPQDVDRADGYTLHRGVDDNGWIRSITDYKNQVTSYDYENGFGRLTSVAPPSPWNGTTFTYSYPNGALVQTQTQTSDPKVEKITATYDAMLRPTQIQRESLTAVDNIFVNITYDAMGRKTFSSLPSDQPGSLNGIQTSYDALGRVTQVAETASGGGTTLYAYLTGNKTQITDPLQYQTTNTFSGYGDPTDGYLVKTQLPEGIVVDYGYGQYGELTSISQLKSDGTQHVSTFEYNSHLLICRKKIPEIGNSVFKYNADDETISYAEGQASGTGCVTPPTDSAVNVTYDLAGRLKDTDYPGSAPDIYRWFDPNGNLTNVNRGGVNWTYGYNSLDVLVSERLELDGRSYETVNVFDPNVALKSKTYPSGRAYDYENDGHLRPVQIGYAGTNYLSVTKYHPNGKIETLNRGNGGTYQQGFNTRDLVSSIGGNWGSSLQSIIYDLRGQVSSIDSANNNYDRVFTYDGVNRLKTASGPWGSGSYTYDTLNNLRQRSEGSHTVTMTPTANNLVATVVDNAISSAARSYSYDPRGNVASEGTGRHTFTYDFANQPVTMGGLDTGSFTYDGNFNRAKEVINGKTIYSFYDRSGAILTRDEVTGSRQVTDFLNLSGQTFVRVTNGVPSYPLNDLLGTAYMVADQGGTITAANTYNYSPFGEALGTNSPGKQNKQGYTGHIEDESGLVYMQARYYDSGTGRFLSPDPVGYAESLNLYAYVNNDPVNNLDPTGQTCTREGAAGMYRCNIDFYITTDGTTVDFSRFATVMDPDFIKKVDDFNARYTAAVNALMQNPSNPKTVKLWVGNKSVLVSADKVGQALIGRTMTINDGPETEENRKPDALGTLASSNTTFVGPEALEATGALPTGGLKNAQHKQEVEIAHEGIHGNDVGVDSKLRGNLSQREWKNAHQSKYDNAAKQLLKPNK